MKLETMRALDRWLGVPLCFALSLWPRRQVINRPPRRILVELLSEMGSMVLALPMLEALERRYPDATVHLLVFERNAALLDLLDGDLADRAITIRDSSLGVFVADSLRALRRMRRLGIDTVLDCELFSRVSSLYAALSGASIRVGFERHTQEGLYRGGYINRQVLYNPYRHISRQFMSLVDAIESDGMPRVKTEDEATLPEIAPFSPREEELNRVREGLAVRFPGIDPERLVLVHAGGGLLPVRAWPEARYAELCSRLVEAGWTVGLTGPPEDRAMAKRVLAQCTGDGIFDLTGYTTTIRELVLLFFVGRLLITNDGGPGHFTALARIPAIVLYGPETPMLYGTLNPRAREIYRPCACSPCLTAYNHRKTPCDGDNVCLAGVSCDDVFDAAVNLIRDQTG